MQKKLLTAAAALLLTVSLTGCVKVPTLENGEELVAELNGKQITAGNLYEELRTKYGVDSLVSIVDEYIISQELEDTSNEEAEAKAYVKQVKDYYVSNGQNWENVLASNGLTEKTFTDMYTMNYARESVAKKFYRESVTDKEIEKFYEKDIIGDITAKHILIKVDAKDDMSDEEKTKADKDAYNKAMEVVNKLKEGKDFSELAKEYSDDSSASEGGSLAPFNKQSNYTSEFLDAAVALKPGEYSKTPVKSKYGYHIILVEAKADKPSLDDVKTRIINLIADEKMEANENYVNIAWKGVREKYKLTIYDTIIDEKYKTAVNNY